MTAEQIFQNKNLSVKVPAMIFFLYVLEFKGQSTHFRSFRTQSVNLKIPVVHDYLE